MVKAYQAASMTVQESEGDLWSGECKTTLFLVVERLRDVVLVDEERAKMEGGW
jgi:hypothetical protein